jgi:hypothetical protein
VANQPIADDGTLECVCYFLIKEKDRIQKRRRMEDWQGRKEINHRRRK